MSIMKSALVLAAVVTFGGLTSTHAATIYLNDSFDSFGPHWKKRGGGQDKKNPGPVIVSDGFSGKGLRIRFNAGTYKAADYEYRFASQPTELYFRYYLRLGDNWKPTDTGKLPGPANVLSDCGLGNKPCSDSKPGFSARMWFSGRVERTGVRDWEQGHSRIGYYVYHMNQQNIWGDAWRWNRNGVNMQLALGQWHCVEGRIKLNTPGQPDGILQAWFNGERLDSGHSDDIVFRTASQASTKIRAFWLDVYHGGPVSAPATMDVYVDELVLSSARIGCGFGKSFTDLSGTHKTNVEELTMRGGTLRCSQAHRFCQGSGARRYEVAEMFHRSLALESRFDEPANFDPAKVGTFTDDDGTYANYERAIEWMATNDITLGCGGGKFCPGRTVTRGQIASFLHRAFKNAPGYNAALNKPNAFNDDNGSIHEKAINWVAYYGLSAGCSASDPKKFCPNNPVTRAQLATFLIRGMDR